MLEINGLTIMKYIYLILAAVLLLCLAPMPYGYFTFVRIAATIVFLLKAIEYYKLKKEGLVITLSALAVLFQPFFKIALGRTMWNVIDVIVAIGLIVLFIVEKRKVVRPTVNTHQKPTKDPMKQEDNVFEFSLNGRLAPKELVYVASEEDNNLTDYFNKHPEVLEGWGQMIGFQIIYLPLLIKKLTDKRVLQYRAPYLTDAEVSDISIGNDFMLQFLENSADRNKIKQGFIRTENIHRGSDGKDKATNRFYPLSSASSESLSDQFHRIGKQISAEENRNDRLLEDKSLVSDDLVDVDSHKSPYSSVNNDYSSQEEEVSTDDLLEEVRERIARLRQRGIAEFILEQLIHPDNRLSRLVITKDWRILLPDYNDMEIKMDPLAKAVYLLYLKHPEGIAFKQLPDYKKELMQFYEQLKPSGLTEKALQSIEDVTNPTLNSINEKCARIRAAFLGRFDDYMAKNYYVDGLRGEAKRISLPRNLVIWE